MDLDTLFEIINALDSWGSPSDVFTAIGGFFAGLLSGPIGLTISRFIERKMGREKCSFTGACLNKNKDKDIKEIKEPENT